MIIFVDFCIFQVTWYKSKHKYVPLRTASMFSELWGSITILLLNYKAVGVEKVWRLKGDAKPS